MADDKDQLELFPVEKKSDDDLLVTSPDEPEPVEKESEVQADTSANPEIAKQVTGYRNLSSEDIAWMNTIKGAEIELGAVLNNVRELVDGVDRELIKDAEKHFRTGFMLLLRSVARPEDPFV